MTPDEAHDTLVEAGAVRELLAAKGRWPRGYLLVYAVGAAATFALVGLAGTPGIIAAAVLWPAVIIVMQRSGRARPVTERGGRRAITTGTVLWSLLYVGGLGIGYGCFRSDPLYWIPAALVIALPFLIAACWRRTV